MDGNQTCRGNTVLTFNMQDGCNFEDAPIQLGSVNSTLSTILNELRSISRQQGVIERYNVYATFQVVVPAPGKVVDFQNPGTPRVSGGMYSGFFTVTGIGMAGAWLPAGGYYTVEVGGWKDGSGLAMLNLTLEQNGLGVPALIGQIGLSTSEKITTFKVYVPPNGIIRVGGLTSDLNTYANLDVFVVTS